MRRDGMLISYNPRRSDEYSFTFYLFGQITKKSNKT